jgi:hypothetical protein
MTHQRCLILTLLLAIATVACETSNPLAPASESFSADPLASVFSVASGGDPVLTSATGDPVPVPGTITRADPSPRGNGGSLWERLAKEIPGFGGLYRNGHCAVAVVLVDMSEAEHAIRVVHAVIEPLVVAGCPAGIRVEAVRGQFTYIELNRYHAAARELLHIRGVLGSHIDYKQNRLIIAVRSREVALEVLEALPRVGIPAEAVMFEVGDGAAPQREPAREPTREPTREPAPTRTRG